MSQPHVWMYAALTLVAVVCYALSLDPIWVPIACVTAVLFDDSYELWKERE